MENYSIKWVDRTKKRLVEIFGGKCQSCGYSSKSIRVFDFHHVDPKTKSFTISNWSIRNWKKIFNEVQKCVMVCANCHREIHDGFRKCPKQISVVSDYVLYESLKEIRICSCKTSFKVGITSRRKLCDSCIKNKQASNIRKVDWTKYDLKSALKTKTKVQIAKELNISEGAVRKRLKKVNA